MGAGYIGKPRLELGRVAPLEPKSSASTNSATCPRPGDPLKYHAAGAIPFRTMEKLDYASLVGKIFDKKQFAVRAFRHRNSNAPVIRIQHIFAVRRAIVQCIACSRSVRRHCDVFAREAKTNAAVAKPIERRAAVTRLMREKIILRHVAG